MPYERLVCGPCYTAYDEEKLLNRINEKSHAKVCRIRGQWLYYVHSSKQGVLPKVKQLLLQAAEVSEGLPLYQGDSGNSVEIHITPRNISPWSSKATSIAYVCGLGDQVHRIERARSIVIEFVGKYSGEQDLSFRDEIYDRMTENFSLEPPNLDTMFAEGRRKPLEVVDIFADARGPLVALQDFNRQMGLGLDEPSMEYLVAEYKNLGRSPVCRLLKSITSKNYLSCSCSYMFRNC